MLTCEIKRPTIAIDVDGVLRNNLGIMVDMYNNEFNQNLKISDVNEFMVDISFPLVQEKLHIKASEYFFRKKAKEVFLDAPAYDGVKDDIERLKEVADVIIITYQKGYENKKYALQWLEKNGIDPNGICFLRDKTIVHCDALVDDNYWNFWGTHVKTSVMVDAPYNKDINLTELLQKTNSNAIYRVKSFDEFTNEYLKGNITI